MTLSNHGLDEPRRQGWRQVPCPSGRFVAGARVFQKDVADGHLSVIVAPEPPGWHLSISHRRAILDPFTGAPLPGRIPTWDEIRDARYLFCPDEIYMAMILPPRAEYLNVHATTMHLHEIPAEVGR